MIITIALLSIAQAHRKPPEALLFAGISIDGGSLTRLQDRIGVGATVAREYANDGWTYWQVRGRREWVTAYWEPAAPQFRRTLSGLVIDDSPPSNQVNSVDPSQLGFWGTIQLGVRPKKLIQQLRAYGSPRNTGPNTLTWKVKGIPINAQFEAGRLQSIWINH